MPFKSLMVGLVCGLLVWAVLDVIQTRSLEKIFSDHLQGQLDAAVIEGRIRFDQHVKRQARTIKLLAANTLISDYLSHDPWRGHRDDDVIYYKNLTPEWFPPVSRWRGLMQPGHVLLLDTSGRVREDYQVSREPLPDELTNIDELLLRQTQQQAYMAMISGSPYLFASEPVLGRDGQRRGYLLLVSRLDSAFLRASQDSLPTAGAVVALLGGDERRVLASSSSRVLGVDVLLDSVEHDYLVTGQSFFDYGSSDFRLQFVTLVPRTQVAVINAEVLDLERRQRVIAALAFVLAFTLVMVLVSGRINRLLHRVTSFSQRTLGLNMRDIGSGDQLILLEQQIGVLTTEVLETREAMRKHHELQLSESEAFKAAILEAALDTIITVDHNGRILEFNSAAEKAFGYPKSQVMNRELAGLIMPDEFCETFRAGIASYLADTPDGLMGQRLEVETVRHDGSSFPAELVVTPAQVGEETVFTAYVQDITRRKEAELEIQLLANFARENPNPVLRVDRDNRIVFANLASEPLLSMWGRVSGEMLPDEIARIVDSALNSGVDVEHESEQGDRMYSLVISPMQEFGYADIYGRDVSETRRVEAQSRRNQAELIHVSRFSTMGEMAAGLAHELNQPLSAIVNYARGCTRRMNKGDIPEDVMHQALDEITNQAERAGEIIRGLRALVQKREPIREAVEINHIIEESVRFSEYEAKKNGATIELDLVEDALEVRVDMVQIEQVVLNLIRNALDAMQVTDMSERNIWIRTYSTSDHVEISVRDSGPGVSDKGLDRIFHPFYTEKPQGMGMGLPISKTIIEAHDGELWVQSDKEAGADFRIRLPRFEGGEKADE